MSAGFSASPGLSARLEPSGRCLSCGVQAARRTKNALVGDEGYPSESRIELRSPARITYLDLAREPTERRTHVYATMTMETSGVGRNRPSRAIMPRRHVELPGIDPIPALLLRRLRGALNRTGRL